MLGVGVDWAEEFHDVALGRPGDGVFDEIHVGHTSAAIDALIARIATLEPDARGARGHRDPPQAARRAARGRRVHGAAGQP